MFVPKFIQKATFTTMNRKTYLLLTIVCLCAACGNKSHKAQAADIQTAHTDTISTFTLPSIPAMLTKPEARASYLIEHYWEHTNFADSNYIHHPDMVEQAWVNYIDLMRLVPYPTAKASLENTFNDKGKHKKCYLYLMELAEKYLYDPNSPMRNEELYIPVLESILATQVLDDMEKTRSKSHLEWVLKNRQGSIATDFTYTLASGVQGTLHALKAPYVLLYINNPGCHACHETLNELESDIEKMKAETACLFEWEGIRYLIDSLAVTYPERAMEYDKQPDQLCTMAEECINRHKPTFLAVCFDQLDHTGHADGHDTPAYYATLERLDTYVGRIIEALKQAGIYDDTIIMMTADHGGINKGHGGKTLQEMEIPFIIAGKNIRQGGEFKECMMQFDTAATIAYIFGLQQPQAWIGRPMKQVFLDETNK